MATAEATSGLRITPVGKRPWLRSQNDIAETIDNMCCGACHGDDSSDNQPTNSPDVAKLMVKVCDRVRSIGGDLAARRVESWWNGIGGWQG